MIIGEMIQVLVVCDVCQKEEIVTCRRYDAGAGNRDAFGLYPDYTSYDRQGFMFYKPKWTTIRDWDKLETKTLCTECSNIKDIIE